MVKFKMLLFSSVTGGSPLFFGSLSTNTKINMLDKLIETLQADGFTVIQKYDDHINFEDLEIFGQIISGEYLNSGVTTVFVDVKSLFDKASKCPIKLPLPSNEEELKFLLDKIDWLRSPEGFKVSNEYETENWICGYPK